MAVIDRLAIRLGNVKSLAGVLDLLQLGRCALQGAVELVFTGKCADVLPERELVQLRVLRGLCRPQAKRFFDKPDALSLTKLLDLSLLLEDCVAAGLDNVDGIGFDDRCSNVHDCALLLFSSL